MPIRRQFANDSSDSTSEGASERGSAPYPFIPNWVVLSASVEDEDRPVYKRRIVERRIAHSSLTTTSVAVVRHARHPFFSPPSKQAAGTGTETETGTGTGTGTRGTRQHADKGRQGTNERTNDTPDDTLASAGAETGAVDLGSARLDVGATSPGVQASRRLGVQAFRPGLVEVSRIEDEPEEREQ